MSVVPVETPWDSVGGILVVPTTIIVLVGMAYSPSYARCTCENPSLDNWGNIILHALPDGTGVTVEPSFATL